MSGKQSGLFSLAMALEVRSRKRAWISENRWREM
jgi:hypothetical protein